MHPGTPQWRRTPQWRPQGRSSGAQVPPPAEAASLEALLEVPPLQAEEAPLHGKRRPQGTPLALAALLAWIAGVSAGCASAPRPAPRPVFLTTDLGCEVDDQWALAHLVLAAADGEVDLWGVATTHAPNLPPPAAESSARAARGLLSILSPAARPLVVAGSSEPLEGADRPRRSPGAEFLLEVSKRFEPRQRLTVIALGAATDVASALLLDPAMADRVEVVVMGFEGWPRGGDSWNVKNDPHAYRVLLRSRAPLTVGSAEVCLRHLVLDSEAARSRTKDGGRAGEELQRLLEGWIAREGELCRKITGRSAWPIWDLITVAHLLGHTRDELRARPRLAEDLTFEQRGGGGSLRWITTVDARALWRDLESRLRRHARPR